jgi:hypothetical protein
MAASMAMCLEALGLRDCNEDTVNNVMGAAPMRGAAWEQALATAQHYGVRATLTVPSTLVQVKEWTDRGVPVMIAWNPEGREWSHASVVFDVTPCPIHGFMVHVADSNCPDPEQTVRVVPKAEFYAKWFEKWPNYLVRRPALALEREITPDGRQVMASQQLPSEVFMSKQAKAPVPVVQKKPSTLVGQAPAQRNVVVQGLIERGTSGAGKHKNKQDYERGHARQPKHRGKGYDESMTLPVEEACGAEYMGGEACGAEYMQDHSARFEEGVPADPTKNMSEADAAEWNRQNELHRDQFTKTAARYAGDPYWLVAKYPGKDHKGRPFRKGERVFYYPKTKTILMGEEAERAAAEFEAAAFDEDFGYRSAGLLPSEIAQIRAAKTAANTFRPGDMAMWNGKRVMVLDTHGFPPRAVDVRWTESGVSGSKGEVANTKRNVPTNQLTKLARHESESVGLAPKTAADFPRWFDMTENPLQTLKRVPGFQAVSDTALSTKNRAFGIVPTNTLSRHQLSQIASISPNDTLALVDKHGMALWVGSPADLKLNLKSTTRSPWPEVRESAGLAPKTAAHRLDGVRGHQLLPATVARKLPAIYSQESVDDPVAQVKLFSPYSGAVWYLTEYDPSSKQAFGWADLGMGGGELGYIDINELEGLNRRGLPLVERDLYWKPMPLSRAKHSRTASQQVRAKFPRGEKMTVDEVAEVVGPEFKEMNENPPPEVVAVRDQMEKQARSWTPEQRLLTALGAVAEAVQHVGLLAREAKPASQSADKALKWLEAAEQILGRDVARDLSLPGYRG